MTNSNFNFDHLINLILDIDYLGNKNEALKLRWSHDLFDGISFGYTDTDTMNDKDDTEKLYSIIGITDNEKNAINKFNAIDLTSKNGDEYTKWLRANGSAITSIDKKILASDTALKNFSKEKLKEKLDTIGSDLSFDFEHTDYTTVAMCIYIDLTHSLDIGTDAYKWLNLQWKSKTQFTYKDFVKQGFYDFITNNQDKFTKYNYKISDSKDASDYDTGGKILSKLSDFFYTAKNSLYTLSGDAERYVNSKLLEKSLGTTDDNISSPKKFYFAQGGEWLKLRNVGVYNKLDDVAYNVLKLLTYSHDNGEPELPTLFTFKSILDKLDEDQLKACLSIFYTIDKFKKNTDELLDMEEDEITEDRALLTYGMLNKMTEYSQLLQKYSFTLSTAALFDSFNIEFAKLYTEHDIDESRDFNFLDLELNLPNFDTFSYIYPQDFQESFVDNDYMYLEYIDEFIEHFIHYNANDNSNVATNRDDVTLPLSHKGLSEIIDHSITNNSNKDYVTTYLYSNDEDDYAFSTLLTNSQVIHYLEEARRANHQFTADSELSLSIANFNTLEDGLVYQLKTGNELDNVSKLKEMMNGITAKEQVDPSFLMNIVSSGDVKVQEAIDKQADIIVKLHAAQKKVRDLQSREDLIKGYKRLHSNNSNIVEGLYEYYELLKTGDERHADTLEVILAIAENNDASIDLVNSPEFCSLIVLALYTIYAMNKGDGMSFEDYSSSISYNKRKHQLKGIQSLPGWIDINQIRYTEWKPQLSQLKDSDFWKYYANFYTFAENKLNPYNSLFDKDGFIDQQEMALNAKKRMETDRDVLKDKLTDLFYGPKSIFNDNSLWTFTNLVADVFKELEEPFTCNIVVGGIGNTLMNFFKNVSVEVTSTLILEIFTKLMQTDFIDIDGKKKSFLDVYNEMLMLQKLFGVMNPDNPEKTNTQQQHLDELKTAMLSTDTMTGRMLDRNCYFALNGDNFYSSDLSQFMSSVNTDALTDDTFFEQLNKDENGKVYSLFNTSIPTWNAFNIAISFKTHDNSEVVLNSKDHSSLIGILSTMTDTQKQYAFMCSVEDLTGQGIEAYLISLTKPGAFLDGVIAKTDILDIGNFFPTRGMDKNFDYMQHCNSLFEKYPQIFIFSGTPDFNYYLKEVENNIGDFDTAIQKNLEAITAILMNQENGLLVDTVARLLPTTSLLTNVYNVPLLKKIDKIVEWFEEFIKSALDWINTHLGYEKKRTIEFTKRESRILLRSNYAIKIRAFSTLIDIIYNDALNISICFGATDLTDIELAYEALKNIRKELAKYRLKNTDSKVDSHENPDANPNENTDYSPIRNERYNTNQNYVDPDNRHIEVVPGHQTDMISQISKELINKKIVVKNPTNNLIDNKLFKVIPTTSNNNTFSGPIKHINNDKELLDHLKTGSQQPVAVNGGDLGNKLTDYITPTTDIMVDAARRQIANATIKETIDGIINNLTDNGIDQQYNQETIDRTIGLRDFITHSDAGILSSIDFGKVNSHKFLNNLNQFDFQDFINFRYTTLKMLGKFD